MLIHAYIQWWHEILLMWLLVEAIGFCAFPLMSRIASNLRDRGYAMSKVAGLAMLTFFTWMFSHVLGYGITAIILAFSTMALLSIATLKKKPAISFTAKRFDQTFLKFVEIDLIFTVSFLFFIALQMYHPFIEGGPTTTLYTGERFMGSAFLNAINRATSLPPPDPWLSGYALQHYYYFGYLMGSILTKLSAMPTNITFNLLTPLCAALTASITYGLGYNLMGKRKYGLLTATLVVFIGNLHLFKMLLEQLSTSPDIVLHYIGTKWDYYYWSSTRALFDTNQAITEFPFFSFIWGDFHPHMIGLAFQVLIISLLYAFISNPRSIFGNEKSTAFFSVLVFGISLGFLYANSAWDYPGYAVLSLLVIGAYQLKRGLSLKYSILSASLPVAVSIFLYLPYILAFKAIGAKGIGIVMYPSPIAGFLLVHGLPLLAIAFFALSQKWEDLAVKEIFLLMLSSLLLVPLLLILSIIYPALIFILPVIFFSFIFIFREIKTKNGVPREVFFAFCLILGGASMLFFSEVFYVMDYLAWGEFQRMNTVFKFYNQVWVMWMISAAFCIWYTLKNQKEKLRRVFSVCMVILIFASGIYPVLGTYTWLKGFETSPTLDGTAYLKYSSIRVDGASIEPQGDYLAICWIGKNIKGSPVILEAVPSNAPWDQQFDYTYYSRVSSLTGLPTLVGWVFHEHSWGYKTDITEYRINDVNIIYSTEDVELAVKKLEVYDVKYVFVGSLEHMQYPERGLRKFEDKKIFKRIYDERGVQIYEVL